MPNRRATVVKASQPEISANCVYCAKPLEGDAAPHVCSFCGRPQPARGADYFAAFGVERCFGQDRGALERKFFALSRLLHPDRFMRSPEDLRAATERMSLINQAYRTLRDPALLRHYLLVLEGFIEPENRSEGGPGRRAGGTGRAAAPQIPAELAEAWFELRDLMMEEPERAVSAIADFELCLREHLSSEQQKIEALEKEFDETRCRPVLEAIGAAVGRVTYLRSLERDFLKMKATV